LPKQKPQPPVSLTENVFEWGLFDNLLVWQQYMILLTFSCQQRKSNQQAGQKILILKAVLLQFVFLVLKSCSMSVARLLKKSWSPSGHHNKETRA